MICLREDDKIAEGFGLARCRQRKQVHWSS